MQIEIVTACMDSWEDLAHFFLRNLATAYGDALLRVVSAQPLLKDCPELCKEFRYDGRTASPFCCMPAIVFGCMH